MHWNAQIIQELQVNSDQWLNEMNSAYQDDLDQSHAVIENSLYPLYDEEYNVQIKMKEKIQQSLMNLIRPYVECAEHDGQLK